jgi:hypothetical protein
MPEVEQQNVEMRDERDLRTKDMDYFFNTSFLIFFLQAIIVVGAVGANIYLTRRETIKTSKKIMKLFDMKVKQHGDRLSRSQTRAFHRTRELEDMKVKMEKIEARMADMAKQQPSSDFHDAYLTHRGFYLAKIGLDPKQKYDIEDIERAWKSTVKKVHPDVGGSEHEFELAKKAKSFFEKYPDYR